MLNLNLWNMVFILINLLVWYWFIRRFLFGPVKEILAKRQRMVDESLEAAHQSRAAADKLRADYEASLAQARQEADRLMESAKAKAEAGYQDMMQQAKADAQRQLEATQKQLTLEKEKTVRELEQQLGELTVLAAGKLLSKSHSAEDDRELYDLFLKEKEEAHEQSGS